MKQKSEIELTVAEALASARVAIRLKHTNLANREINRVLPQIEANIMEAAAAGKPYQPNISALFYTDEDF